MKHISWILSAMFDLNARVVTPKGNGSVVFRRMSPPDYREPAAYSVLLDKDKAASEKPPFPNARGTIFPAVDVTKE